MKFSPKPLQKPHIPLLIGGVSRAAIRRAARLGNGWHPTALPPEELSQGIRYLQQQAQAAGRDVSEIPVSITIPMGAPTGRRQYSLGTDPAEMLHKAQTFESLGVERMVVSPSTDNVEQLLSTMEMLAQEMLPAFQQ